MVQYRLADQADFPHIVALLQDKADLCRTYPAGQYPFSINQLQQLSRIRKELTVMLYNGQITGFANLYAVQQGVSAFIGNVIIAAEYRGKGLGRQLVQHMIQQAQEKYQLQQVNLSVVNDNTTALLLYSSLGFQPYAIEAQQHGSAKTTALIHMKKTLEQT